MNGAALSGLDLDLMQSLFSHQRLQLLLKRDESPDPEEEPAAAVWPEPGEPADPCQPPGLPNLQTWTTGTTNTEPVFKFRLEVRGSHCRLVGFTDYPSPGETPDVVPPPVFDDVSLRSSEDGVSTGQVRFSVYSRTMSLWFIVYFLRSVHFLFSIMFSYMSGS